jgi:hypothetical protein
VTAKVFVDAGCSQDFQPIRERHARVDLFRDPGLTFREGHTSHERARDVAKNEGMAALTNSFVSSAPMHTLRHVSASTLPVRRQLPENGI